MNKTALIIVTLGLVVAIGFIFYGGSGSTSAQNVEIKNGVQYITITAKGGYFPNISTAKGDTPTKLIVETNGTYDCSASLVIKSINYQKILPRSGETEIDLGIPKTGESFQGVCGMGMYNFEVKFI